MRKPRLKEESETKCLCRRKAYLAIARDPAPRTLKMKLPKGIFYKYLQIVASDQIQFFLSRRKESCITYIVVVVEFALIRSPFII